MTFEIASYDWGWFGWFVVITFVVALFLGIGLSMILDHPGPAVFFVITGGVIILVGIFGLGNAKDSFNYDEKVAGIESLGYSDVEASDEGYNQWVGSKDGEFVRLAVTLVESNTYLVTEIQE